MSQSRHTMVALLTKWIDIIGDIRTLARWQNRPGTRYNCWKYRVKKRLCGDAVLALATCLGWTGLVPDQATAMIQSSHSPEPFAVLTACREIENSTLRLNCYDSAAAELETARVEGEVLILDRATVQESQRRSFGFNVNTLNPFPRGDGPPDLEEITSTLKAARQIGPGQKWLITLEDGSIWLQTDTATPYVRRPQGQPVRIRRASMGSYLMTIDNSAAFGVRRQNGD
jgi:hypothetical protein